MISKWLAKWKLTLNKNESNRKKTLTIKSFIGSHVILPEQNWGLWPGPLWLPFHLLVNQLTYQLVCLKISLVVLKSHWIIVVDRNIFFAGIRPERCWFHVVSFDETLVDNCWVFYADWLCERWRRPSCWLFFCIWQFFVHFWSLQFLPV